MSKKPKFEEERQAKTKTVVPKNDNQRTYIQLLQTKALVIAEGSAGTGKTFLAASIGANRLVNQAGYRIYLTRPYVAMGRSTGMWPGSIEEKLSPYLAPMLSVIKKQIGDGAYNSGLGKSIFIHPLEAIRGESFENCLIICDEGQNLLPEEARSLVTRLGDGAQLVICGDTKQKDIKGEDGITYLKKIIRKYSIQDTGIVEFTSDDIVRSGIVKEFVKAFDSEGEKNDKKTAY